MSERDQAGIYAAEALRAVLAQPTDAHAVALLRSRGANAVRHAELAGLLGPAEPPTKPKPLRRRRRPSADTEATSHQLLAASIEVDRGLGALVKALQRRREFIEELAGLGVATGHLAAVDGAVCALLAPVLDALAASMEAGDRERLQAAGAMRTEDDGEAARLLAAKRAGAVM